uniref:Uncharacterized protein n=1 Tax=Candidatus Methanophaga sp. ANME-1 ERB7 TaxID=2759913 RepID=A0A7G9Z4Z5_9EURY|nr:hypothetical protein BDIJAKCO_00003 [Methanosarcinales archaeon ANME-1 ERB7]
MLTGLARVVNAEDADLANAGLELFVGFKGSHRFLVRLLYAEWRGEDISDNGVSFAHPATAPVAFPTGDGFRKPQGPEEFERDYIKIMIFVQ